MAADLFTTCTDCRITEYENGQEYLFDVKDFAGRRPAPENLDKVEIAYTFTTTTIPETTVDLIYTVYMSGLLHIKMCYHGKKGLPQLPEFGFRLILPEKVEKYTWVGLSGETYPDRIKGGIFGTYEEECSISDYLVPQECRNHAGTCEASVGALKIFMDKERFSFSAIPYMPQELENALHREELHASCRTVVSILGKMRGVGGINSWGADVEDAYHISGEEDMELEFYICGR